MFAYCGLVVELQLHSAAKTLLTFLFGSPSPASTSRPRLTRPECPGVSRGLGELDVGREAARGGPQDVRHRRGVPMGSVGTRWAERWRWAGGFWLGALLGNAQGVGFFGGGGQLKLESWLTFHVLEGLERPLPRGKKTKTKQKQENKKNTWKGPGNFGAQVLPERRASYGVFLPIPVSFHGSVLFAFRGPQPLAFCGVMLQGQICLALKRTGAILRAHNLTPDIEASIANRQHVFFSAWQQEFLCHRLCVLKFVVCRFVPEPWCLWCAQFSSTRFL